MAEISREDLAYAAGIIDGEGCISIMRRQVGTLPVNYCLYVRVATTDKYIAPWLHEKFGGSLALIKQYGDYNRARAWSIASASAENFLRMVYPWLKNKKAEAELAFEFRKSFKNGTGHYIGEVLREERRQMYEQMRRLKRGGRTWQSA